MTKKTKHTIMYAGLAIVAVAGIMYYRKMQKNKQAAASMAAASISTPKATPSFGTNTGSNFFNQTYGG